MKRLTTNSAMTAVYLLIFAALMTMLVQGTQSGVLDGATTFRFRNWQWGLLLPAGAGLLYFAFRLKAGLLRLVVGAALVFGLWLHLFGG